MIVGDGSKRNPIKITIKSISLCIIITTLLVNGIFYTVHATDDGEDQEIAIWWVNDYDDNPALESVSNCDTDAEQFYNGLYDRDLFVRSGNYGDDDAQENHWEKSSVSGDDDDYIETVDIAWFTGHGGYNKIHFNEDNDGDSTDTRQVYYPEVEWGDGDLEWVFLQSCRSLRSNDISNWDDAFGGFHGICGFHSVTYACWDGRFGNWTAHYMTEDGYTVGEAWEAATKHIFSASETAAIYRGILAYGETTWDYYDEYLGYHMGDYTEPGYSLDDIVYDSWSC